ncbi:sigma-70 family RNA polymerase sigma factor [Nonomuraea sp. NPDC048916]|uniref:sigma-70 family RNA polymerase sigma factor n=1 Tax=Nonomuraea sp. NPDC048916 TaxID=3154232 RepID=UPI0034042C5A
MSVQSVRSDADLLHAVRDGDAAAYGELYQRHVVAARSLARQLVRGEAEVEDVVAESFTKILDLVGRGGGPTAGFRTYLLTVVRRTVYDRIRIERRQVTTGEIESFDPGVPFVDPAVAGLERSLIARAFQSLPERWRAVLWHTEVESAKAAEVAPLLGLSANGVAALAYRAREGLRQAYLQMHLAVPPRPVCRPVLGKMGAHVRGGLARRDSRAVAEHVSRCPDCHAVMTELADVDQGLRTAVGPLMLGPAFAGYVAAMAGATTGTPGRIRWPPARRPVALASGAALAVAAAAALLLVAGEEVTKPLAQPMAALQPPPIPRVADLSEPAGSTPVPPPSASETARPGRARLRGTIDPLGALVRAQPGIVGVRLRNTGKGPSQAVEAAVELPSGVTPLPPGRRGGRAGLLEPVGAADGWKCRPAGGGARCARGPLAAGQATAVFLRVQVAATAPSGAGPSLQVQAGALRLSARSASGVRSTGAPARFAADGEVVVRAVGNSLLTCPADHYGCAEARIRRGETRDNDLWPMVALDRDGLASTAASSAAALRLPRAGRVVWAGLYWSASAAAAGPIKIKPPGRRGYVPIRPDEVLARELPSGPAYQAFADVTGLVGSAAKEGEWWAADAPMQPGVARYAGWSLVVVMADPAQPYGRAVVLDPATVAGGDEPPVRMPLDGLGPPGAPARIELVTWEGDAGLSGEVVSVGSGPLVPAGGDRDPANVFDGSANGARGMAFGVDVDSFGARLGRDPALMISTKKDATLLGVAAISVRADQ